LVAGTDPDPGADPAEVDRARAELARLLGAGEVLGDPLALALYNRDASMIEGACSLVAFPRNREQVAGCLAIAERHGLAVVPRGSGTGLAGGSTPMAGSLAVVTTKMDRVLAVRPDDLLAWVEPGVLNLDLSERLRPLGFVFAPDPSSQQTSSAAASGRVGRGGPRRGAAGQAVEGAARARSARCRRWRPITTCTTPWSRAAG
jgi:FAD/FMN-containing dehydrogenase